MANINPEYFLTIVEEGTLTRAAQRLYVSQSSLSQYLKRLEKNLGVDLFDHGTSPLRLTYAGKRFYEHVRQMMKQDENLRRELRDLSDELSGVVRLGVALWRGASLLPDVFPSYHEKYPNVRLQLEEGPGSQMTQALENDRIDFAVMNLPHTLDYTRFVCRTLCEERFLVAMPEHHPLVQETLKNAKTFRGNPVVPFEVLEKMPWISSMPGMHSTVEVSHLLGKHQIRPDVLLSTANLTTGINLVAKGMGYCFIPERGASVCQRPGKVRYFEADAPGHAWTLAAVYRRDVYLSRAAQLFIEEAAEVYSRDPAPVGC